MPVPQRYISFIILNVLYLCPAEASKNTILEHVNPLIGSTNGGNVFAGASLPYGMAKAVADVDGQNTGGFSTDGSRVIGFSALHDSGTGGNPSLGNFPLFPQYCPGNDINNCKFPREARAEHYQNESVVASPRYFAVTLENGITAQITTAEHAALFRFRFPLSTTTAKDGNEEVLNPMVMLDLTDLWESRQNASVAVDGSSGRIRANATFLPSFGAGTYRAYFCADFGRARVHDSGVWVNDRAGTEPKELFVTRGFNLFYLQAGGFVQFEPPEDRIVNARVGVSFISTDRACENAEKEIPGPDYDFEGLVQHAEDEWTKKLSPVSVKSGGASNDLLSSFWSGIYRTMLDPQDLTGENPLWESDEPYFDSFYW